MISSNSESDKFCRILILIISSSLYLWPGVTNAFAGMGQYDFITQDGFIQMWNLLGAFDQPPENAPYHTPGVDRMRLDYQTDGELTERNYNPYPGMEIETDFEGASASTGYRNPRNPPLSPAPDSGVAVWDLWIDSDDTVFFDEYYSGDENNVVMYATTYIAIDSPQILDVGLSSDDSIQVLLDNEEVWINNVARGVSSSPQDVFRLPELSAGVHKVMVKVFEGGGGHGFKLRFQDAETGAPVTDQLAILPAMPEPTGGSQNFAFVSIDQRTPGTVSVSVTDGVNTIMPFDKKPIPGLTAFDGRTTFGARTGGHFQIKTLTMSMSPTHQMARANSGCPRHSLLPTRRIIPPFTVTTHNHLLRKMDGFG